MNAFYALEPRWFRLDLFYKVYVTPDDLRGACIGRQVYHADSALRQLIAPAAIFAPLMRLWAARILRNVQRRELEYDAIALSPDVLLGRDRSNFVIPRADITQIEVDRKRRFWTGNSPISGTLRLRLRNGKQREWILTPSQDIDAIAGEIGGSTTIPTP
jgi:hypothetical protein